MPAVDWSQLFVFTVSPAELFLRGSMVYLLVFVLMRLFRREAGTLGIADLLMVVLIADASQNAMSHEYRSVLDGFVLIFTIVFWNYAIDWASSHFRFVERFTHPAPIPLIRKGHIIAENMRREFVTHEELVSILRANGVERVSDVKAAFIEGSGHTSVIKNQQNDPEDDSTGNHKPV
jgi:uncharacterized membrane protein YcaP (DUF421 family)